MLTRCGLEPSTYQPSRSGGFFSPARWHSSCCRDRPHAFQDGSVCGLSSSSPPASLLLYWWADVSKAPSRLVAAVRREARAEDRPDRQILIDEINVADRRALRTLTGFRRHVRLTVDGFVHLPSTGGYRFEIRCDDYCALKIGTRVIGRGSAELIDAWLEAGTYPFRVSYQQGSGPALVSLEWNRPRFVELLPMRKLVSGRQELLSSNRLRVSAIHVAALILLSTCWWMFFAVGLARAASSVKRCTSGTSS